MGLKPRGKHWTSEQLETQPATKADTERLKSDYLQGGSYVVHRGDLTLDGDFFAGHTPLIVDGTMKVKGTVFVEEMGALVVVGDLVARNLSCEGDLEVQGDLVVAETVFGYYEAGITTVYGTLFATLFLSGNHSFEVAASAAETHLGFDNFSGLHTGTNTQAKTLLSDNALSLLADLIGIKHTSVSSASYSDTLRGRGFLRSRVPFSHALHTLEAQRQSAPTSSNGLDGDELCKLIGLPATDAGLLTKLREFGFRGKIQIDRDGDGCVCFAHTHGFQIDFEESRVSGFQFNSGDYSRPLPLELTWSAGAQVRYPELERCGTPPDSGYVVYDAGDFCLDLNFEKGKISMVGVGDMERWLAFKAQQ